MKTFDEIRNEPLMTESIGIVDGQLVFDYNELSPSDDQISSNLGKKFKGAKFVPFTTTTSTFAKHKVKSVYAVKGNIKSQILKAIKRQSAVDVGSGEYTQFLRRTATFIDFKIIRKNKIDTIVAPTSSSVILTDLLDILSKKNPSLTILNKTFKKNKPEDIQIDYDHPKITPKIIAYLEKQLAIAKKAGYFEMKAIKASMFRKFIKNIMKLNKDISLRNHVEDKRVLLIDDILASGNTITDMMSHLELYAPSELMILTIFKSNSMKKKK